jgi:hypothetical protein
MNENVLNYARLQLRAPLTKSSKLTSEILSTLGLCCLRASPLAGHPGRSKLVISGIADRDSAGDRVWFRNERDAKRVLDAFLSRCFESTRKDTGLTVKLPLDKVVGLATTIARSLGITPIQDCDVTTTFDSLHRRIETAIAKMPRHQRAMKNLRGVTDHDLTGLLARL